MAVNNNSLKNIKPALPGEVRNPKGKAKGTLSAKTIIRKWLKAKELTNNPITGIQEKLSQLDIITLQQIVKAKKGDTQAFNALLDRSEGKATQAVELGGKEDSPIEISFDNLPYVSTEDIFRYLDGKL